MIQSKTFVSGEIVTVTQVEKIQARRVINNKDTDTFFREIKITDSQSNHITLQIYADDKEKIKIIKEK